MNRRSFVASTAAGVAAGGVSAGSAALPSSAGSPLKDYVPRGSRRILYVSDPSSIAIHYLPDPATEESIREWVDQLSAARVDVFVQEAYTQGWTTYWRVDGLEYDARPQHRRFLPLLERGVQPLEVLLDQCHKRGMEFLAGIRINDNHGHISVEQGVGAGASFLLDHPEWQIRELPPGPYYKLSTPMDFTFPQVRDYVVGAMERLVDRFPVDGLELCFRDHRYFPPGKGPERKDLMTELVERSRAILNEAGRLRRKKLLLGRACLSDPGRMPVPGTGRGELDLPRTDRLRRSQRHHAHRTQRAIRGVSQSDSRRQLPPLSGNASLDQPAHAEASGQ